MTWLKWQSRNTLNNLGRPLFVRVRNNLRDMGCNTGHLANSRMRHTQNKEMDCHHISSNCYHISYN